MATYTSEMNSLILRNTTNQIVLGNQDGLGATTTITCPTPSASRTYTINDAGNNASIQLTVSSTVAVTATAAIAASQSGSTFFINSAAAAVTLSLPAVAAGLKFTMVVTSSSLANAVTIAAPSAVLNAIVLSADGTAVSSQPQTAKTNYIIGTGAKACDYVEIVCDGTNYWCRGATSVHTSVTFS